MADERKTTTNYQLYLIDKRFKDNFNLIDTVERNQNFFIGKQYPNDNYKNMIRVVLNICSMCVKIKTSRICGTPIYLAFTADNLDTDCSALRQFDEYNCNKLRLKQTNKEACENAFVCGTEVTYIRWDSEDTSYKGIYKGGLAEEHMDLRKFAVANPYIQNIQKQQWVMFWEDYPVGALKEMVEGRSKEEIARKKELIVGSEHEDNETMNKDAINHALCRMYTRFFRIDGEVYFMCSTKDVDLFSHPHPLSTQISNAVIQKVVKDYEKRLEKDHSENGDKVEDYNIDYEDFALNIIPEEHFTDAEYKKIKEKFNLYPFAVYTPYPVSRNFYGAADIDGLITIQKGINFAISMALKCMENNAYNKIFAKEDALGDQEITNEPGQVIFDKSKWTNSWGIKFAESQPMPNGLIEFVSNLLSMTRVVYGFTEVMDGTVNEGDTSGYAIAQMIKATNTTLEQQQQLFWLYNEDKAAIRLLYYKHYVDEAKYVVELEDTEYDQQEQARKDLLNKLKKGEQLQINPNATVDEFSKPTHKKQIRKLNKKDLYGVDFDISIEAMQGVNDSELIEQQMFDNLLLNGGINNVSPEILSLYITASPNVSQRTKAQLKKVLEHLENSKIRMLEGKLQEATGVLQQVMAYAKKLESMNKYQGTYLKNLQNEFTNKVNSQNKIINGLSMDLSKYTNTPTNEGEVKSNNARGISGTNLNR